MVFNESVRHACEVGVNFNLAVSAWLLMCQGEVRGLVFAILCCAGEGVGQGLGFVLVDLPLECRLLDLGIECVWAGTC